MKTVDTNISCPSCRGPLRPATLACDPCGLRIEGTFAANEFASLSQEHLHVLRIFVHCDGRIRDMEKALGVSYPTVKSMLAQMKAALGVPTGDTESEDEGRAEPEAPAAAPAPPKPQKSTPRAKSAAAGETAMSILSAMESGQITHAEATARLRRLNEPKKS
jgi:hypothetical protein